MHAFRKRGLVNWDQYFSERMETSSVCEKDKKRKVRQNFVQELCVHTVNRQTTNTKKELQIVCRHSV